jgi:PKD repeat protein
MHPVGSSWVSGHHDYINGNLAQCQACHGTDYRGTVLSRAFAARTFTTELGTRQVFRGAQVGCYMCHNGPFSSSATSNHAPVASNISVSATSAAAVSIPLTATDPDGNSLTLRIVSQPGKGMAAIDSTGVKAIYRPYVGASGTDTFTYAAWDGSIDSNLATVTVNVVACTVSVTASAPATAAVNSPVSFTGSATSSCAGTASYDWNFGDGSAHSPAQNPSHTYVTTGTFQWTLTATVAGVVSTRTGSITVGGGGGTTSCTVTATATVPTSGTVGTAVGFSSTVSTSGCSGGVTYDWDFGDNSPHATTQNASHAYQAAGTYTWRLQASAGGTVSTRSGNITISTTRRHRKG